MIKVNIIKIEVEATDECEPADDDIKERQCSCEAG